jgi:hypothetical protein
MNGQRPRANRLKPNSPCWCGSGRKLKKCHRDGKQQDESSVATNRKRPILSAAGDPITFQQLVEYVGRLDHSVGDVAFSVLEDARVAIGPLGIEQVEDRRHYHVWQIGAAVMADLARAGGALGLPAAGVPKLPRAESLALLTRAGGLASASRIAEGANVSEREREKIILRTLCTRSSLQREFVYQFALTLHLLGVWDVEQGQVGDGYCDALFQAAYGCSSRDYAEILFAFWAMGARGIALTPSAWFERSADPARHRAAAGRIISRLACPATDVARLLQEEFAQYEADGMVQAWFAQRPFVALEGDVFLAPPLPFLRLAASSSVFYQALALARDAAERAGSTKPFTNAHSSEMGRRFETFMTFLMGKATAPGDELWAEYEYMKRGNQKSADFLVTSTTSPREVLVVQTKLKRLVPGAFYGFSPDAFRVDAKGALAELLSKSIHYLYLVHTTPDDRLEETHRPLHDALRQATSIVLLGVVPALPALFQANEFRSIVLEGAAEQLTEAEKAWFEANKNRLSLWHILDAEELCAFVAARKDARRERETLLGALRSYVTAPGFGDLARPDGILSSFRDWYVTERCGGRVKERIAELWQVFDAFCRATSEKFFGPDSWPKSGV